MAYERATGTLTCEERLALLNVVWPKAEHLREVAMSIWFRQGIGEFDFDGREKTLWGSTEGHSPLRVPLVVEQLNGPCGLLAVVQAEMASRLLRAGTTGAGSVDMVAVARDAMIESIVSILVRTERVARAFGRGGAVVLALAADAHGGEIKVTRTLAEEVNVPAAVAAAIEALSAPPGAVLLLYSLVLTFGIKAVQDALTAEGAALGVPPAESLIVSNEHQHGGFCEVALVSLAALGRPINSFTSSAWGMVNKDEAPPLGVLTSEDEAFGEEAVAPWLRMPSCSSSMTSFVFIDGLARTLTHCRVLLGEHAEAPDSEALLLAMRAVEILQYRNGEYYAWRGLSSAGATTLPSVAATSESLRLVAKVALRLVFGRDSGMRGGIVGTATSARPVSLPSTTPRQAHARSAESLTWNAVMGTGCQHRTSRQHS